MSELPILIAGAGIGGLAAALALARSGRHVLLREKAPDLVEVGAGIQLTPNACRVLFALGLERDLVARSVRPAATIVRRGRDGAVLARIPLGESVIAAYGAPWLVIHRADLQDLLLRAARAERRIDIAMDAPLTGIEIEPDGARVAIGLDPPLRVAGFVGADGLWSAARRLLGDAGEPDHSGRTAFRAVIPMAIAPAALKGEETGLWLGAGAHLVHYPIKGGDILNIVAIIQNGAMGEGWDQTGDAEALACRFGTWTSLARDLVAAPAEWRAWPLMARGTWFGPGRGPVTLLGDASHPTMPFLAQGGAAAIEDASVLARMVVEHRDIAGAFRAYEAIRVPRVRRLQREASLNGMTYHMTGPLAFARDAVIGLRGGAGLLSRYDWIYSWQPDGV